MGWYPEAVRKPLETRLSNRRRPMPSPKRINLHTAVSTGKSLKTYWDSQGVFSHFYVREDGVVEQYQDTKYRSACDLDGNPDTISVESWDGATYPTRAWTIPQVVAIAKLVRWLRKEHPSIPDKLATDNRRGWTSYGLSYHQLGVPYDKKPGYAKYTPKEGGLYYTTSRGKECPGKLRILQVPGILDLSRNPKVVEAPDKPATLPEPPKKELNDMPYTPEELANIVRASVIGVLETPRYGEYVDEDGDKTRDVRSIADILFSTHSNAVSTNRASTNLLAAIGKVQNVDPKRIAEELVASIKPVIEASVASVIAEKVELADETAYNPQEIALAVADEIQKRMVG